MQKILIIDDEKSICNVMTEILNDEGYKAFSAESGEKGLDIIKNEQIDLIFLDIWLPETDGIAVLETLKKEINFTGPVIMISGHANIDNAVKAVEYGAFDFLEKPLTLDKITTVLKNAEEALNKETVVQEKKQEPEQKTNSLQQRKLEFEKQCIQETLNNSQTLKEAAEELQLNEDELKKLIKTHGLKI
jgi:two-component system nitrogen regulation response regulator NtrX